MRKNLKLGTLNNLFTELSTFPSDGTLTIPSHCFCPGNHLCPDNSPINRHSLFAKNRSVTHVQVHQIKLIVVSQQFTEHSRSFI